MSIPAFAWALEQGRVRNLPTSERMLLVVIADRGNGRRACSAGQECLANDTGLKQRQVRISLQRLEAEGLIRIEKVGKSRLYHVLRPANGEDRSPTPAHTAGNEAHEHRHGMPVSPAHTAGVQCTTPAREAPTPAVCAETPAHTAAKPYKNQENQDARAGTREEASGLRNSSVGRKSLDALPASRSEPPEDPEPTAAEIEANRKRQLEEIAAMPPPLAAAVRNLANAFEHRYHGPGRWPERAVEAQVEEVAPRAIRPAHLTGAALAAARAACGIRVPA